MEFILLYPIVGSTLMDFPIGHSSSQAIRQAALRMTGVFVILLLACGLASAQRNSLEKMPVVDKITNPSSHQAFTGTVQSLDEKLKILNVDAVGGGGTEIFPIKKGTSVIGSGGARLKLTNLTPGTNIIVYYEQRTDHRSVERVEIIGAESKKSAPHS
jgi:hypothetical protein